VKTYEKPLPDIIGENLKVLFVGYNPGITSARMRHHYSHRSNRFWRLMFESGLTPYKFSSEDDYKLLELGFGSTNIVDRPTREAGEISKEELRIGAYNLYEMIKEIKPQIVCYAGIGVYKAYASVILGKPLSNIKVSPGLQPESIIEGIKDFVCPNPSGLNTMPYHEQLRYYKELKALISETE